LTLYNEGKVPFELKENEYLIVKACDSGSTFYCYENGQLRKFTGGSIKTVKDTTPVLLEEQKQKPEKSQKSQTKKYSKGKNIVITPRNEEQVCAFDLMKDPTKTVKLLTGTWGTGKTLILVSAALEALKQGRFEKIVWIRNNVDVKDTKDLGALPGEVIDKLLPFLGPFIDHAGENSVRTMLNKGSLVVEPLQSLRGRNFENTLIMCSEAENLTKEHIQLIIARAAEGSEVWFDADNRQRDKASFEKSKGIETLIEKFAGQKLFGYVHLIKSERSETAALADLLN
jgi:PhoH-like ATPase